MGRWDKETEEADEDAEEEAGEAEAEENKL